MKVVSIATSVALAAVVVSIVAVSSASHAEGQKVHRASKPYTHGKIEYCTNCHGSSGQGYQGFYTMPRLAGQTSEYLEEQLSAFVERRRGRHFPVTLAKVHGITPSLRAPIADHFSNVGTHRTVKAVRAPKGLAGKGQTIFNDGVPEANIPACAVCHGPDGQGLGPNPRLAGQLYPYTTKTLANWARDRGQGGPDASSIMLPIAQSMTKEQIAAVAAYVSQLK